MGPLIAESTLIRPLGPHKVGATGAQLIRPGRLDYIPIRVAGIGRFRPMLTHGKVWSAIDSLAKRYGLAPSGLAKKAGLDPTSFNPSKRVTNEGRPRWPTTESVAKVLEATGASLDDFVALVEAQRNSRRKFQQPIP